MLGRAETPDPTYTRHVRKSSNPRWIGFFGIDAVFSTEALRFPETAESCAVDEDEVPLQGVTGLNCAGFGSAMVVTASFGLVAVAQVLRKLALDVAVAHHAVD